MDKKDRSKGIKEEQEELYSIELDDIFDLSELQKLQDTFSNAHGVASVITDTKGKPYTRPSNFTRFCREIIRTTEKGCANCFHSDSLIGQYNTKGPNVQACLSSGLWDAGVSISVGGKYIANWLIGQVRTEQVDEQKIIQYADEIGADLEEYKKALNEVPVVSTEQFKRIADLLLVFANGFSEKAYNNMLLKKQIAENNKINHLLAKREEKIKQERILLRTIIDSIPDAIYVKDLQGKKVIANNSDCINCGFEKEEDVIGKTDYDFFSKDVAEQLSKDEHAILYHGESIINREEYLERTPDQGKYFLSSKLPLHDDKGELIGLVGIGHDITERKINEQLLKEKNNEIEKQNELLKQTNVRLKDAKEKAEQSDRLKSAFLANMSHEIRTPMNGILGFADLLKRPNLIKERRQEYIDIIVNSGARMLNILNDIIDISKIEAGLMKLDIKDSNINEQVGYIYNFFKPEAEEKNIKLSFKTPLIDRDAGVKTDPEKLYAVLTNLVKNAIKFTKDNPIELGYRLIEKGGTAQLRFFVKDKGIGIPKDRQKAIFDRFIQADVADKMAYQGAGLGLALCKAYVEMLGGDIWVKSKEGKGSTFYFTIPYKNVKPDQTLSDSFPSLVKTKVKRKLKILIAEDDAISQKLLTDAVEHIASEVFLAKNGVEAVELAQKNTDIDLIMMDIRMPLLNGYGAVKRIRAFNQSVIIIAQTAYGFSDACEKAIKAGCNNYIAKPFNEEKLLGLLEKYFMK